MAALSPLVELGKGPAHFLFHIVTRPEVLMRSTGLSSWSPVDSVSLDQVDGAFVVISSEIVSASIDSSAPFLVHPRCLALEE